MTATLAIKQAALLAQGALQVDPFHGSGNSIDSRDASGERVFFYQLALGLQHQLERIQ